MALQFWQDQQVCLSPVCHSLYRQSWHDFHRVSLASSLHSLHHCAQYVLLIAVFCFYSTHVCCIKQE
jgi:hypothetical protein